MFGTVRLPATKFKRLLLRGPPSAECATDSGVLSARRFRDSLGGVQTFSRPPRARWLSSAAADFLRANALRFAPPAAPSTSTIRSGWWWPVFDATPLLLPNDAPSAFLPALPPGSGQRLD